MNDKAEIELEVKRMVDVDFPSIVLEHQKELYEEGKLSHAPTCITIYLV